MLKKIKLKGQKVFLFLCNSTKTLTLAKKKDWLCKSVTKKTDDQDGAWGIENEADEWITSKGRKREEWEKKVAKQRSRGGKEEKHADGLES